MHISHIIATLPILFGFAAADCWSTSGPKVDQTYGLRNTYGHSVLMSGKFRDGQKKIACISDYGAGNHYYITVTKANGDGTADAKYLDWGIQREMGGCERGGHSWDGDWEFNVDVLSGVCYDIDFISAHPEDVPNLPHS